MTPHVSDRDKEQVVIDLDNLQSISCHPQKCMGQLPQELNVLFASVSHCVARLVTACTSYARTPPLQIMLAGHACAAILSNMSAGISDAQSSPNSVENHLVSTGSILMTALYAGARGLSVPHLTFITALMFKWQCRFYHRLLMLRIQILFFECISFLLGVGH